MMPIGPLMIEHRLIEEMISIMKEEIQKIKKFQKVNPLHIDTFVDFIRMYADRTHHGKEEDILFRDLKNKNLSPNHEKIMEELVEEHKQAREKTGSLVRAKENYMSGNMEAVNDIIQIIDDLVNFYPKHIEKEDKHFFIPIMKYFSKEEQNKMLDEFREFDKKLIHEKYKNIVENLQKK